MAQKITLRPYQQTDTEAIEKAWEQYRAVLYQLPTGGGKSIIFTKLINDYKKEKIIIFAHKKKLLKQIKNHLVNTFGIKPGMLTGFIKENLDSNILLVSIRSAVKEKRLEWLIKKNWDRVIIDEARHSRTGSYDIVLDRLLVVHPTHKLLGVDATPYRKDKKRLDKHFQVLVKSCETVKSLQEKGYLCNIKTYATPIGEIEEQVKQVANDYQQSQLSNYMRQQKYLDYVVDAYTKFGEKKQAIVFAVDKEHSKDLKTAFVAKGYKSVKQIDSDLSDNEIDKVYEDYENKKIDILINIEMITEGVDLPDTGCIVGARPTKSLVLYLQMGGRLLRPKLDGGDGIMIDCAGWTEEFGTLNSPKEWSLDPDVDPNDPRKKNRIVGKTKEGKLTTDLKEMDEFTELVEMTPEDYIAKVEGGMKAAQKQNLSIDEKIRKVEVELEELLHEAAVKSLKEKVSPFMCVVQQDLYDEEELNAYFFHKVQFMKKPKRRRSNDEEDSEIDAWKDGSHVVEMKLARREKMYALLNNGFGRYGESSNKNSIEQYREISLVCGEVNMMIADNKNLMMKIIDKYQQIHDLKKSKINLSLYKDLQKKLEQDKWKQSVTDHLKSGKPFVLGHPLSEDSYFKGYSNDKILEITVPKGQIDTYHNTIILKVKDNSYYAKNEAPHSKEKKYVKGEKLYELLKDGEWGKN